LKLVGMAVLGSRVLRRLSGNWGLTAAPRLNKLERKAEEY